MIYCRKPNTTVPETKPTTPGQTTLGTPPTTVDNKPPPQQNVGSGSNPDPTPDHTPDGRRIVPVHESRIKDRPVKKDEKDSSLKIKIELDLEVEVEIYARIKGDVTIGLM